MLKKHTALMLKETYRTSTCINNMNKVKEYEFFFSDISYPGELG